MSDSLADVGKKLSFTRTHVTFATKGRTGGDEKYEIRLDDPYLPVRMYSIVTRHRSGNHDPAVQLVLPADLVLCAECPPGIDVGPVLFEFVAQVFGKIPADELHATLAHVAGQSCVLAAERSVVDEAVSFARRHGLNPVSVLVPVFGAPGEAEAELLCLQDGFTDLPSDKDQAAAPDRPSSRMPPALQREVLKRRMDDFRKLAPTKRAPLVSSKDKRLMPDLGARSQRLLGALAGVNRSASRFFGKSFKGLHFHLMGSRVKDAAGAVRHRSGLLVGRTIPAAERLGQALRSARARLTNAPAWLWVSSRRTAQAGLSRVAAHGDTLLRGLKTTGTAITTSFGSGLRAGLDPASRLLDHAQSGAWRGLELGRTSMAALVTKERQTRRSARDWAGSLSDRLIRRPIRHTALQAQRGMRLGNARLFAVTRATQGRLRAWTAAAVHTTGGIGSSVSHVFTRAGHRQEAVIRSNWASFQAWRPVANWKFTAHPAMSLAAVGLVALGTIGGLQLMRGAPAVGTDDITLAAMSDPASEGMTPPPPVVVYAISMTFPEPAASFHHEDPALPIRPDAPRPTGIGMTRLLLPNLGPLPADADTALASMPTPPPAPVETAMQRDDLPPNHGASHLALPSQSTPDSEAPRTIPDATLSVAATESAAMGTARPPRRPERDQLRDPRQRDEATLSEAPGSETTGSDVAQTAQEPAAVAGLDRSPRPPARSPVTAQARSQPTAPAEPVGTQAMVVAQGQVPGIRVLAIVGSDQQRQALVRIGATRTEIVVAGSTISAGLVREIRRDGIVLSTGGQDILLWLEPRPAGPATSLR
jgi:hypothetical protein